VSPSSKQNAEGAIARAADLENASARSRKDAGLIYVSSRLNTKFRNKKVKGGVQNIDNASLVDNGSVFGGEICYKETEEKVR